ncbi:MAG: hypothetical protein HQ534_11015 [Armatimonadetes bacterium]|nr:hypothetical protein [Armatimonadota bacterium]
MRRIISLICFMLIISSLLFSVEITLINKEILSGNLLKQEDKKIYFSKDKELYIIDDQVIESIQYKIVEKDQQAKKINWNSFKVIHKINEENIWTHDFFVTRNIESFSMNGEEVPFKYFKLMKIQLSNGDIIVSRYLGETDTEIKLLLQAEKSFLKQNVQMIWLLSEHEKNGKVTGGLTGSLLGLFVGGLVGAYYGSYCNNDFQAFLSMTLITALGTVIGNELGRLTGSLFEKEKLVWSKN